MLEQHLNEEVCSTFGVKGRYQHLYHKSETKVRDSKFGRIMILYGKGAVFCKNSSLTVRKLSLVLKNGAKKISLLHFFQKKAPPASLR